MASYEVAHIREQGVDLIIVPLDSSFGHKVSSEQRRIISALQLCASSAGLRGTVVPVWEDSGGRMGFIAPQGYHPFFSGLDLSFVAMNINRELTCG